MKKFDVPPGVSTVFHNRARWRKPFGYWHARDRLIEVWPCAWIPTWFGLQRKAERLTFNHEVLHAWGNPGCDRPWCLGYEGATWKEWLAMPVQLLAGFRFCGECRDYYRG